MPQNVVLPGPAPWGFRLTGGIDFNQPLIISRIFTPENLGMVSGEQGEQFHKDIQLIEPRYQGSWNESMMADYCWMLYRDNLDIAYTRKSYFTCF